MVVALDEISENGGDGRRRALVAAFACVALAVATLAFLGDSVLSRAVLIAGTCLILWLSEVVPAYVPTFVLWTLTPLLLGPLAPRFEFGEVLKWSANPILMLFFGGFAFGVAASRHGLDRSIARLAVRLSRGHRIALVALAATVTALMSMWLSNIAAAAMMIAALRPLTKRQADDGRFSRALLMAVAVGANFGGIATPIGTGPNAIAMSALERWHHVTFGEWMAFALPLTIGLIAAGTIMIKLVYGVSGRFDAGLGEDDAGTEPLTGRALALVGIFIAAISLWLTEPLHGVSSPVVAVGAAALLFGGGLLKRKDLGSIDWGTMALIAGGVGIGTLLESAGVIDVAAKQIDWAALPLTAKVLALCFTSATLAALMSNTATVTMLIPFAAAIVGEPSVAVLVAVAASLGVPFIISTPINSMVYGEGGVSGKDFFMIGFPLMILGCALLALTGFEFLKTWF